jgi:hypothetical protein
MSFRGLFIAVVLATAMLVSAFAINRYRPAIEVNKPTAALIRATGKCADCHRHETEAVVHEFELSKHNTSGVTCLNCHQPADGQENYDHKGFIISRKVTAANCKTCHAEEYEQYLKSRHAAPAWAAVTGKADFTPQQIAFAEQHHKGAVDRAPHDLIAVQGPQSVTKGCFKCHEVGRPNEDGTIGSCTSCHARHVSSVELARQPETCGQCHMGPDHAQLEIYHESKHGVLFNAQKAHMNLAADPKKLTAADMPVPTCATCHMSGLNGEKPGEKLTHDVGERLSYYLFAPVSERRPNYRSKQTAMKGMCLECHTNPKIIKFYTEAEGVVRSTNTLVKEAEAIMKDLRAQKLLTPEPFDEPIEYTYFDLWHYGGRTAKHGAFMGGADFVQWHGYYELVSKLTELKHASAELKAKGQPEASDASGAFAGGGAEAAKAAAAPAGEKATFDREATASPKAPSGYPEADKGAKP